MKLFITVLLSLLLLQSATGLHLHAEEEGSGNFTTTSEASNITANETATFDVDATYSDMTEEDEQISKALKDFDEIQISGDEELIAAAKEAINAFKAASEENTEKVLAASILSEEATDQERQEALEKVQKIKNEFKEALNNLTTKLQELKSKLQERLANTGSE